MLRRRVALVAASAVLLAFLIAPGTAAAASPFAGTWRGIDTDGSTQSLIVSAGPTPAVVYQDFYANGCDRSGFPATHWQSAGRGVVDGDVLFVDFHKSGCGRFSIGAYGASWTYDAGTDTIADDFGNIYYRFH